MAVAEPRNACQPARAMRRNATIDDVAKAAGVARTTVSRVLNNGANVRLETRERVQRAIEQLGFSVNRQARALASGAGRQVMLIHVHNPEREPNSYYHAGLELGALRACSSVSADLITRAVDPQAGNPWRTIAAIIDRDRPMGLIVTPPLSDDLQLLQSARRAAVNMIAISAGEEARKSVSAVGIDERSGGRTLGEHLASLGHRRLGMVKGPPDHRAAALRYDGFVEALRSAGIEADPWTATGDFTFKSGVEAAEKLLADGAGITALACANDDMAAGAMLALHRAGLDIPSDISVAGFDDTPMSEIIWPPLTTVRQPIQYFAERAVHLLFDGHGQSDVAVRYETIEHQLIVRDSTASPRQVSLRLTQGSL
jgi:LacI family transcriptional regulator